MRHIAGWMIDFAVAFRAPFIDTVVTGLDDLGSLSIEKCEVCSPIQVIVS